MNKLVPYVKRQLVLYAEKKQLFEESQYFFEKRVI
jgi:hypothetical protein